jgi:hypothetical protein
MSSTPKSSSLRSHWTVPISREETLVIREKFRSNFGRVQAVLSVFQLLLQPRCLKGKKQQKPICTRFRRAVITLLVGLCGISGVEECITITQSILHYVQYSSRYVWFLTNSLSVPQLKYAPRIPAIVPTMPITIPAIVPPPRPDPLLAPWLGFPVGLMVVVELRLTIVTEEGTNKVTKAVRCQRLMLELQRVVGFEPLKALHNLDCEQEK